MHKTVNISIGNALFTIEESAFKQLDTYLDSIRNHFGHSAEADEIVEDIEGRIAEALTNKLTGRKKVILTKDVEAVIEQLGTVEDFKEFEGEETSEVPHKEDWMRHLKRIRLYRDADDQILGGVCSGIAKYFDIDPIITRLIFALSLLVGGFGFVLYIVLWFLLPEARTTSEKVEMTGGRVTLSAIQKRIDATIPPERRKTMLHKIFAFPFAVLRSIFRGIGTVFRFLIPLAARLLGAVIILGCCFAIAMATFVLIVLVINPASPYIGFPLREVISITEYILLLTSGYVVIIFPVIFVLVFGASLISLRNQYTGAAITAMTAVWFLFAITLGATIFTSAPKIEVAYEDYQGSVQNNASQEYDFSDFSKLEIDGNVEFTVTQGDTFSVRVESTEKSQGEFSVTEDNDVLTFKKGFSKNRCIILCPHERVALTVTMPQLSEILVNGTPRGTVFGFEEDSLTLDANGIAYIEADVDTKNLTVSANGASTIIVNGSGETLNLTLNGVSEFDGYTYAIQTADVELNGPVRASLNATKSITGEANGPARIMLNSEPETISVEERGPVYIGPAEYDDREEW